MGFVWNEKEGFINLYCLGVKFVRMFSFCYRMKEDIYLWL